MARISIHLPRKDGILPPPVALDVPESVTGEFIFELFHLDPNSILRPIINRKIKWDWKVEPGDTYIVANDREFYLDN